MAMRAPRKGRAATLAPPGREFYRARFWVTLVRGRVYPIFLVPSSEKAWR